MTMPNNSSSDPAGGVGYSYATSMVNTGDDPNPWDPGAVQGLITQELETIREMLGNKQDPTFALYYVMFLMQEYGVQKVGQQADMQNEMNKYFSQIQDAWNMVHSANSPTAPGGDNTPTDQFLADLQKIIDEIKADKFFNDPSHPERLSMAAEITGNLTNLEQLVKYDIPSQIPDANRHNALWYLWQIYNGNTSAVPFTGNKTALMDQLNRGMGQLNQQLTGESQAVAAITQAVAKTQQAEQDQMNNFAKAIQKLLSYFNQQFKTG